MTEQDKMNDSEHNQVSNILGEIAAAYIAQQGQSVEPEPMREDDDSTISWEVFTARKPIEPEPMREDDDGLGQFIRGGPTFDNQGRQVYGEWGYERYVCAGGQVYHGDPIEWRITLINGESFKAYTPFTWNEDHLRGALMAQAGLVLEAFKSVDIE